MKSVMISIQPKWVEKILSGEKTIEVRKSKPRLDVPFKCYVYETKGATDVPWIDEEGHCIFKGRGEVVGEFICDNAKPIFPADYTCLNDISYKSCLTNQQIAEYGDFKRIYAWHISDLVIYDKPKELGEFLTVCKCTDTENDKHCFGCKYFWDESNESSGYDSGCACDGMKKLERPPQSWGYVESADQQ